MRLPEPAPDWPESWRLSHGYDQMEIGDDLRDPGYTYAYRQRRDQTLALVRSVAAPGARILDLAAAQGNFSLALAELGYDVTWNDLRADLVGYVKLKHDRGTLHYLPGNLLELASPTPFDVVLITEVIEHVAHPDDFLRQVAALVRPGGHLVMTTPNGQYFRNRLPKFTDCSDPSLFEAHQFKPDADGHIFLLHEHEVRDLARAAGLEMIEARVFTNFLTRGYFKTSLLLRWLPRFCVRGFEAVTRAIPGPLRRRLHVSLAVLLRRTA